MKYSKLIVALFVVAMLASCKKNDNDEESKTKLNDLESKLVGRWQFVKSIDSSTNVDGSTKSVSNGMEDCQSDDIYTFRPDKKYTINHGEKSCSAYDDVSDVVWSIRPDSNFEFDGIDILSPANPKVIRLDNEYFVIQAHSYPSLYNGAVYVTNTYKKL